MPNSYASLAYLCISHRVQTLGSRPIVENNMKGVNTIALQTSIGDVIMESIGERDAPNGYQTARKLAMPKDLAPH